MSDLSGKVAVITGAGRGIGRMTAHYLGQQGMHIGVNDIDAEAAAHVVEELRSAGYQAVALPASVCDKQQVEAMVRRTEQELGPLWLLVNNAGTLSLGPTVDLAEAEWDKTMDVDAKGIFLCSQAAIRSMIPRKEGRIVNFSSIAGMIVRTGQIAYCSAKAAVIHFTRCLAVEMAPYGITVNCICPGMTKTEMLNQAVLGRGLDLDAMIDMIPAGRMATEEDHAQMVAFFASSASVHVTGQVVAVDGAQSLFHPLTRQR
jgi:NAD(P)-dependent dehydrogenase (short-subunit alcohol dehydrogenase family)